MHIPSGNQLMLRRLMCLNKGLSIYYLSISIYPRAKSIPRQTRVPFPKLKPSGLSDAIYRTGKAAGARG